MGSLMKKLAIVLGLALIVSACERTQTTPAVGTEVKVEKKDGVKVAGKLVEAKPEQVVVKAPDGTKPEVLRSQIASVTYANGAPAAPVAPAAPPAPTPKEDAAAEPKRPEFVEVTIPAGTTLSATLATA